MTAELVTALGAAFGGLALIIGAIGSFYMNIRNTRTIKETAERTVLIDHAVNGRAPGAQTLQSQVDDIHHGDFPPAAPLKEEEINGAAILPLVRKLVLMMEEQREHASPPDKPEEASS